MAEQRAEKAEKELKSLEQHREQLQPIMDSVNKELREVGTIELLLPEAGDIMQSLYKFYTQYLTFYKKLPCVSQTRSKILKI